MSIEFDSRFIVLLEVERKRIASESFRRQTRELDSLSARGSGDGFGRRFDSSPRVARRETGQGNIVVNTKEKYKLIQKIVNTFIIFCYPVEYHYVLGR